MQPFQEFSFFRVFESTDFNFNFLGENQKKILVIFAKQNLAEDVAYIEKILSVAQLNLATDCLYTTCAQTETILPNFQMWFEKSNCSQIIVFGLKPELFGCNFQNYLNRCIAFTNNKVVFCDSLQNIRVASTDSKKQLKEALLQLSHL